MNYKKVREALLNSGYATEKDIGRLALRLFLFFIITGGATSAIVNVIAGTAVAIACIVVFALMFVFMFSYTAEGEKQYKTIKLVSMFWWLGIPLLIGGIFVLKMFYFL